VLIKHFDDNTKKTYDEAYVQISPYEILNLALFSTMLVCLTTSFSTLGIYYYNSTQHPKPREKGQSA